MHRSHRQLANPRRARQRPALCLCLAVAVAAAAGSARSLAAEPKPGEGAPTDQRELFDGKTLAGWKEARGAVFAAPGAAVVQDGNLILRGDKGPVGIVCTHKLPRVGYEFGFSLRRTAGTGRAAALVFPIGDAQCEWAIGRSGDLGGLGLVDGKKPTDRANPSFGRLPIRNGQWLSVVLRVEKDRIQAWCKAQGSVVTNRVLNLPTKGHAFTLDERLRPLAPFGLWAGRGTTVELKDIVFHELKAKPTWDPRWTTLFDGTFRGWRTVKGGRFKSAPSSVVSSVNGGLALMSRGDVAAGAAYHWDFPKMDYELVFEAKRALGSSEFASVVFPVGDSHCTWSIGDLGKISALDQVDGKPHTDAENPTRREIAFLQNHWHKFRLRVSRERVEGWIDGKKVVDIPTAGHKFTLWEGHRLLRPFGFFCERHTLSAIGQIRVRRLGEAAAAAPPPTKRCLLKVKAFIDGRSDLVITPGALHWEHHTWVKPSRITINGTPWKPVWQGKRSEPLKLPAIPPSLHGISCAIFKRTARGRLYVQNVAKDRIVVRFDDGPQIGAATYEGEIVVATQAILGLHFAVFGIVDAIESRNFWWASETLERVARQAHREDAQHFFDEVLPIVLGRAVGACHGVALDKAEAYLKLAERMRPGHPDIPALRKWIRDVGRPIFTDNFRDPGLRNWQSDSLDWRVDGARHSYARAVCEASFRNAQMFIKGRKFKDFLLGFDVSSRGDREALWMGAIVRRQPGRFLYCLLSDEKNRLSVGGATGYDRGPVGKAKGATVKYIGPGKVTPAGQAFPVKKRERYRVSVWCKGNTWRCYVDGVLVAEGTDGSPAAGDIGLFVYAGRGEFGHVAIYRPLPFPKVQSKPVP